VAEALSAGGPLGVALFLVSLLMGTVMLAVGLVMRNRAQARFRRRLQRYTKAQSAATPAGRKGQQRRLLIQGKLDELEEGHKRQTERVTLRQRFEMAGVRLTERQFYIGSAVLGVVGFAVPLLGKVSLPAALLFGVAMGLGMPRFILGHLASRRRNKFIDGVADAVDIIVRGIRSGLPLGECLNIIGRESPEPIAGEFRMIMESTRLGLNLTESMERAVKRMPVPEFKFFAIVLTIQQETGGNLAETLANLSGILRDRKQMKDKVKAMSAEARTTATIIGSLPFIMAGILYLTSPKYITLLFTSSQGQVMMLGGAMMMVIGIVVMAKMIAFKI
jgi:tight adherence protein B